MDLTVSIILIGAMSTLLDQTDALDRSDTQEGKLYERLFSDKLQAKFIRPVENVQQPVQVQVSLQLTGLEDLDAGRQVMTSHLWLRQKWYDPFIQWDPSEFGGLNQFLIPVDQIWTPNLVPRNSLAEMFTTHHDSLALAESSGNVSWIVQTRLETFCGMDLSNFPFDHHECAIQLGSWAYDVSKVNLSHWTEPAPTSTPSPSNEVPTHRHPQHQTWEVLGSTVTVDRRHYGWWPVAFQELTAHVSLRRRPTYVTHVFVAPAVMFVLLVPAVFMLPADSSTKFVLGTGIMLSQVLLLLMLEGFLESAFSTIPRLGLYYLTILVLVSFSLGVSAFVANLWNRSRRKSVGVPGVIRVVVLKGIGKMLCVHYDDFLSSEPVAEQDTDTISTNLDSVSNSSMTLNPLDGAKMIREYNSQVVNRAEWRQLAAILDRIFSFVFLVVSALIATAILIKF